MRIHRLAVTAALVGACHGHSEQGVRADEYVYDCMTAPSGVTTFATDESFVAFINKAAAGGVTADDAKAPKLLSPGPGATLSASTPPQFAFQAMASAPRPVGRIQFAMPCPRPSRLPRWLSFEGTAHAHCAGVSGDNYLLRVTQGGTALYTAILSVTSFTPTAAVWKRALDGRAGQMVTIAIERATFLRGDITNGPFAPANPPAFAVGP